MKFKRGDVCEIIDGPGFRRLRSLIGDECVVVGPWPGEQTTPPSYVIDVGGYLCGAYEHLLRLKRPPSWDKWIFDTRDVKHETKTPVLA
jgi:hypothetical protein